MALYSVTFKPSVYRDLKVLPKTDVTRLLARIETMGRDPFPPQSAKLAGSQRLYRIRSGDYRIIYEVDSQSVAIIIHYIRHRREAYRNL